MSSLCIVARQARVKRMMIQSFPIKETLVIHDFVVSTLHSGFELWFREKKSAQHMTFTQS